MRPISAHDLRTLPDQSEKELFISDFDLLSMWEADEVSKDAFRVLDHGGTVEVRVLDWLWCMERSHAVFGTDQVLCDALFGRPRRAVWDERSLVRMFFQHGWYKISTGKPPELPGHMFLLQALKLVGQV
jgi:hypothetical protein